MIEKFLNSVIIFDSETTNVEPDLAEIIELGCAYYNNGWVVESSLFKPNNKISYECSTICNISNRMIKYSPLFKDSLDLVFNMMNFLSKEYFVAHNVKYDVAVLNACFKKAGLDINIYDYVNKENFLCTYRIAKKVIISSEENMKHSQQFLRYYFDLDVDENILPHRAGNDCIICGKLLEKLIELAIQNKLIDGNQEIGPQLSKLCWERIPITTWPIGQKHRNKSLSEIPIDYYEWALTNLDELNENSYKYDEDLAQAIETELNKRPQFLSKLQKGN